MNTTNTLELSTTKKIATGTALALGALALTTSFAYADDGQGMMRGEGMHGHRGGMMQELDEEQRDALHEAMSAGDYDEYVSLSEEYELDRVMTEEQFTERAERHEEMEAIKDAVLDNDYDEWRSLVGDDRMTDVDEDNFYLLVDMAEARESGDEDAIESAREALQAEGIKPGFGKGKGHGKRGGMFGGDQEHIEEMTAEEKQDFFDTMVARLKERLGL